MNTQQQRHVKHAGIIARHDLIPAGIKKKLTTAQTAARGSGANVHDALRDVLYHLRVNHNFTRDEIAQVLAAYDSPARRTDIPEEELEGLVDGLFQDGFKAKARNREDARQRGEIPPTPAPAPDPQERRQRWRQHAEDYVAQSGFVLKNPDQWLSESPLKIPQDPTGMFMAALPALYHPNETVSLVNACLPDGSPIANDRTMYTVGWRNLFAQDGPVKGTGGVWWRHNPVKLAGGTGKNGAVVDADILETRYLLLENDFLDLELQHRLIYALTCSGRIRLRCLTASGGKSLHALAELDPLAFGRQAAELIADLNTWFGFDRSNTNPSRLSRAPGFYRRIGQRAGTDGLQRLFYLRGFECSAEVNP